jgi:uncharacterized membrane protein
MAVFSFRKALAIGVTVLGCGVVVSAQDGATTAPTRSTRGSNNMKGAADATDQWRTAAIERDLDYLGLWPYIGVFIIGVCAAERIRQRRRESEWRQIARVPRDAALAARWTSDSPASVSHQAPTDDDLRHFFRPRHTRQ